MANDSNIGSIEAELALFKRRLQVPAVAAAVIHGDGRLNVAVTGQRRRDAEDPARLEDRWHVGSCLKSITAALYARLVESGQARWSATFAELFPDLLADSRPGWHDRTIDELLHCRAGVQANLSPTYMRAAWRDTRPLAEQRSDIVRWVLKRRPGRRGRFRYSNLSYVLAGAAIDRLAACAYESALARHLLQPLGIRSLGFGAPAHIHGHPGALRLGPLILFRGAAIAPDALRSDNPPVLSSAGTAHLELTDWARLIGVFLDNEDGPLSTKTVRRLLQMPDDHQPSMAMGWSTWSSPGQAHAEPVYLMQGSNTMWAATVLLDADRRKAALVACNDGRSRVLTASALLASRLLEIASGAHELSPSFTSIQL